MRPLHGVCGRCGKHLGCHELLFAYGDYCIVEEDLSPFGLTRWWCPGCYLVKTGHPVEPLTYCNRCADEEDIEYLPRFPLTTTNPLRRVNWVFIPEQLHDGERECGIRCYFGSFRWSREAGVEIDPIEQLIAMREIGGGFGYLQPGGNRHYLAGTYPNPALVETPQPPTQVAPPGDDTYWFTGTTATNIALDGQNVAPLPPPPEDDLVRAMRQIEEARAARRNLRTRTPVAPPLDPASFPEGSLRCRCNKCERF